MGTRLLATRSLQDLLQQLFLFGNAEIVNLSKPAGQGVEIENARPPNRRDGLSFLPREPHLTAHDGARKRAWRHHRDEMLKRLRL